MAILGDIRKRTGLLIGVIGVAMLAFVAGDIFSDQSVIVRLFTGDPNEVGNVDGESITVGEFLNVKHDAFQLQICPKINPINKFGVVWCQIN